MSRGMTFKEFGNLLKYIAENNSPFTSKYPKPSIKYVDPHFDMRTNTVFSLTLRGFGIEDHVFHTQNECRDLPQSLEERVREFLDTSCVVTSPAPQTTPVMAPNGFVC